MKPVDLWKHLVAEAKEDEIDEASSVTVEQAEKELAAAGFDVAVERAKAAALLESVANSAPEEPSADAATESPARSAAAIPVQARSRRPRAALVWLGAAAAVAAGALVFTLLRPTPGPARPLPFPPESDVAAAADLRREAAAACDAQRWNVCLAKLDAARALDPMGDTASAVVQERQRASKNATPARP
jgi:hypothetical protein